MNILKRYAWYGSAVVASFAVAMALLFAGPADTAHALALSNNLETTISLNTNVATGSNTFTTLAPITITCGVVDITAGAANGVFGVTLTLGAGWTFLGGAAPAIGYAWGGGPTGDATGTIASATSITVNILASCDPGDVLTLTGVQVKPLTAGSGDATIIADIATADVTAARLKAQAGAPPPPPPPPDDSPLAPPAPTPIAVVVVVPVVPLAGVVPVIVPVPVAAVCPPGSVVAPPVVIPPGVGQVVAPPVVVPPGTVLVCVPVVAPPGVAPAIVAQVVPPAAGAVPIPPKTGNAGLANGGGTSQAVVWLLGIATAGLVLAGRRLVSRRSAR